MAKQRDRELPINFDITIRVQGYDEIEVTVSRPGGDDPVGVSAWHGSADRWYIDSSTHDLGTRKTLRTWRSRETGIRKLVELAFELMRGERK